MKENKKELRKRKTINYLEEIFSERAHIANPMELDIPGIGKVIATSMVNYHVMDEKIIPYFTFKKGRESGEFFKENNRYFIQLNQQEASK